MKNAQINLLRLIRCVLLALPLGIFFAGTAHAEDAGGPYTARGVVTQINYNDVGEADSFVLNTENEGSITIKLRHPNSRHTDNLQRFKDQETNIEVTYTEGGAQEGKWLKKYSE